MPLTIEYSLTHDPKSWLDTGTTEGVANSTKWHLSECYMYYDIITLDAEVQANYANVLRQGQALNISYHSSLMQSQSVLGAAFTVQVIRNLARVKSLFLTMSRNEELHSKPESTQMFHPTPTDNDDSSIEFNFQLGGKRLIINPMGPHDVAQMYHNLTKAVGILGSQMASTSITLEEYLNVSSDSERKAFILGCDCERVLEAGYSGLDFGNGNSTKFWINTNGTSTCIDTLQL